jgi:hypothetical protein
MLSCRWGEVKDEPSGTAQLCQIVHSCRSQHLDTRLRFSVATMNIPGPGTEARLADRRSTASKTTCGEASVVLRSILGSGLVSARHAVSRRLARQIWVRTAHVYACVSRTNRWRWGAICWGTAQRTHGSGTAIVVPQAHLSAPTAGQERPAKAWAPGDGVGAWHCEPVDAPRPRQRAGPRCGGGAIHSRAATSSAPVVEMRSSALEV